jgi:hypothetical protein
MLSQLYLHCKVYCCFRAGTIISISKLPDTANIANNIDMLKYYDKIKNVNTDISDIRSEASNFKQSIRYRSLQKKMSLY